MKPTSPRLLCLVSVLVLSGRIFVAAGGQPQPDLVVSVDLADLFASPGLDASVLTRAINRIGSGPAPAFSVGLYLSADNTCTTSDALLGTQTYPGLGPGASHDVHTRVTIPADTPISPAFFCAIVDPSDLVSESDEGNNTSSWPVSIHPAAITVRFRVNGVDAPIVNTTGPFALTLEVSSLTLTEPVDWYWVIVYNGTRVWVTPSGLSTTEAPLTTAPPGPLSNVTLLNVTLPPATTILNGLYLALEGRIIGYDAIVTFVEAAASRVP